MKIITFCFCICSFWSFSVSQDVECPPEGVAYLPLPDCTKYIICAHGNPSEFLCPQGLYYNDVTKNCDLPENVPDCVGGWRTTLTECGQTLLANSGVIEYKLNQTYEAGEICTFILRHKYSSFAKFRFVLESHGISSFDPNALIINAFGYYMGEDNYTFVNSMNPTGYLGPPNLIPVTEVTGFVAIVIFKTYSNLGTGFKLSYKVTEYQNDHDNSSYVTGGTDMVFNDESASPISDSQFYSCSEKGCVDMLVFTSSAKFSVDPEYIFKLTMSSTAEESELAKNTCYSVRDFQLDAFSKPSGYCAFNYFENKTWIYETRGIFLVATTNSWRGPQNVTIRWEKSLDLQS